MEVPFLDLSIQYKEIRDEIDTNLQKVFKKGNFILGKEVEEFENEFAEYCGVDYGVGVNSGTDALFLALKALNIGAGDEVIVPAFTYIASSLAISYTGAKPVFCDIEEDTYNINPDLIEDKITDKTKAIMVVHLYGNPVDMQPILDISDKYNIKIIEDCAQAHGAVYRPTRINTNSKSRIDTNKKNDGRETINDGRKVGSFGDVGCFSFYPTKNLAAFGDAGMVVTNNKELRDRLYRLRNYGRKDKYHHVEIGYNSRLDTVQAVILKAKLKKLDKWNELRRNNAEYYNSLLCDIDEIITPIEKDYAKHVYHVYGVRIKDNKRSKVIEKLNDNNISAIIHYPIPLHLQKAYSELKYKEKDFPVSEKIALEILSLPMFPGIKKEQIEYVVRVLKLAFSL